MCLDAMSDMFKCTFKFSTNHRAMPILFLAGTLVLAYVYLYVYDKILNQSVLGASLIIVYGVFCFDWCPLIFSDTNYKLKNIFTMLGDMVTVLIFSLLFTMFYKKFHLAFSKSSIFMGLLIVLNVITTVMIYYKLLIYNREPEFRENTENTWLVKIGDRFKWDVIIDSMNFFPKTRAKKKSDTESLSPGSIAVAHDASSNIGTPTALEANEKPSSSNIETPTALEANEKSQGFLIVVLIGIMIVFFCLIFSIFDRRLRRSSTIAIGDCGLPIPIVELKL